MISLAISDGPENGVRLWGILMMWRAGALRSCSGSASWSYASQQGIWSQVYTIGSSWAPQGMRLLRRTHTSNIWDSSFAARKVTFTSSVTLTTSFMSKTPSDMLKMLIYTKIVSLQVWCNYWEFSLNGRQPMKMFFTPYVRIVFYFCALIFIVYSFSDFFQGVPDSTFFSAVITLLVIGTIVARHLDRKKSLKNTSQI